MIIIYDNKIGNRFEILILQMLNFKGNTIVQYQ